MCFKLSSIKHHAFSFSQAINPISIQDTRTTYIKKTSPTKVALSESWLFLVFVFKIIKNAICKVKIVQIRQKTLPKRELFYYAKVEKKKQAGAELCQAQVKLGLAMLDLLGAKLRSSSLC
jgi:hypothetical protein